MIRVLEIDSYNCGDCSNAVTIGGVLYCPILCCEVKKGSKCQVGVEKSKYDELITSELEEQRAEAVHEVNYLRDCVDELNEMITKLEDEKQTLQVALSLEEMIRS